MNISSKNKFFTCALIAISLITPSAISARQQSTRNNNRTRYQESHKTNRAMLGSTLGVGALGTLIAGAAGGGKWVPLGLIGGTLAGLALGKVIDHCRATSINKTNPKTSSSSPQENVQRKRSPRRQ